MKRIITITTPLVILTCRLNGADQPAIAADPLAGAIIPPEAVLLTRDQIGLTPEQQAAFRARVEKTQARSGELMGKEAGEALNPTFEADYWRTNHGGQSYAADSTYDNYADAYRAGYEGQSKYAAEHKSFENAEPFIRDDYAAFASPLEWERARPASSAAWKRRGEAAEHPSSYPGIGV